MQITQRSEYEKLVLQEIKDLPESEIKKNIKMIQFLKKEVLAKRKNYSFPERKPAASTSGKKDFPDGNSLMNRI